MLNAAAQKTIVITVYAQISQLILCIKGNCTDDTESSEMELHKVTYQKCAKAVDGHLEPEVFSMVKSDADGIGTLLVLLKDLKIDMAYRNTRFEKKANAFSILVE